MLRTRIAHDDTFYSSPDLIKSRTRSYDSRVKLKFLIVTVSFGFFSLLTYGIPGTETVISPVCYTHGATTTEHSLKCQSSELVNRDVYRHFQTSFVEAMSPLDSLMALQRFIVSMALLTRLGLTR